MNFFKIFAATMLAFIISFLLLVALFVGGVSGIALSLLNPEGVNAESVLVIDLRESIVDTPERNPLSMVDFERLTIKQRLTTLDAIRAVERAANDDNIKGVYICPAAGASAPLAILEELRDEIQRFRESGKFVVAYSDVYSQGGYYLSSVADSLYLQREGMVVWQGISANTTYFKGLFDKLDIDVEVFRPTECLYKSAVEPFTRNSMSDESREQSQALVASMWSAVVEDVAASRGITPYMLNAYASSLVGFISREAAAARLVDRLIYEDEMEQIFSRLGVKVKDGGAVNKISLAQYAALQNLYPKESVDAPKVALLYAEGTIVDGRGDVGEIGGDALARDLRRLREDKDIKSVVLRVNSPGGSALASDVVWREMVLLRAAKPVVVSMSSYAASGGYYISLPADVIVTNRTTITGSIGVYGLLFNIEGALSSKLGITTDSAKSNTSSDFMRTSRPITATERAIMRRSVDEVYSTFTSHVATGRNLSKSRVAELSQGRVYSGVDAVTLGLADLCGGMKSAIFIAAERAGVLENFQIEEISPSSYELSSILSFANSLRAISAYDKIARSIKPLQSVDGVVALSFVSVEM